MTARQSQKLPSEPTLWTNFKRQSIQEAVIRAHVPRRAEERDHGACRAGSRHRQGHGLSSLPRQAAAPRRGQGGASRPSTPPERDTTQRRPPPGSWSRTPSATSPTSTKKSSSSASCSTSAKWRACRAAAIRPIATTLVDGVARVIREGIATAPSRHRSGTKGRRDVRGDCVRHRQYNVLLTRAPCRGQRRPDDRQHSSWTSFRVRRNKFAMQAAGRQNADDQAASPAIKDRGAAGRFSPRGDGGSLCTTGLRSIRNSSRPEQSGPAHRPRRNALGSSTRNSGGAASRWPPRAVVAFRGTRRRDRRSRSRRSSTSRSPTIPPPASAWLQARAAEAALGSSRAAYLPEIDLQRQVGRTRMAAVPARTVRHPTTFGAVARAQLSPLRFRRTEREVEQARQTLIAATSCTTRPSRTSSCATSRLLRLPRCEGAARRAGSDDQGAADLARCGRRAASRRRGDDRRRAAGAHRVLAGAAESRNDRRKSAHDRRDAGDGHGIAGHDALRRRRAAARHSARQVAASGRGADARGPEPASRSRRRARRGERAAHACRKCGRRGLPSISLGAVRGGQVRHGSRDLTPYSAGVALRFPLFTGFRNTYDIRAAQRSRSRDGRRAPLSSRSGCRSGRATTRCRRRDAAAGDGARPARQRAAVGDVARDRYKAGVGNILDLLTAEAALETRAPRKSGPRRLVSRRRTTRARHRG